MIGLLRKEMPRIGLGSAVLLGVFSVVALADRCAVASEPQRGTDVSTHMKRLVEADWIARDVLFTANLKGGPEGDLWVVTPEQDAAGGCDGVKNGRWGFHTASGEQDPWWQVDLGRPQKLDRVVVYNRTDRNTAPRTRNIQVLVADRPDPSDSDFRLVYQHSGDPFFGVDGGPPLVVDLKAKDITARVVRLHIPGRCSFALDEVEVYAQDDPKKNIALGRPANQKSVGPYSYPGTLPEGVDRADPPQTQQALFSLEHTRAVIARAKKLADRLRCAENERSLRQLVEQLGELEALIKDKSTSGTDKQQRKDWYFAACRTARRIAWQNPLLDFDRLLFIKRHDARGVFHMCDQFYGCNAVPGGGLFVLNDPFGPAPELVDLLKDQTVQNGRLAGQKLVGGSFLSPDLSFDGQTIVFAYSEAKAWEKYRGKEAYEWKPEYVYHIFKCRADGSGLVQLTHGSWDDFDPCFLPNGKIAFISLRRGGYLRCGRHCPVYTMHAMEADGSQIVRLSHHETHEWQPSVTNEGMIVYTRWDYVDRDTNVAHHIWTCFPDGRDPRSFHGNYPDRRESRPWMEMSIRAIPNSHKFVAVTGAHHGHSFGSLVLIDPRREDDGAMSQLERLTPEVPFPEAEGRPIDRYMIYGTPWPLSEDDYLCAYDPAAKNHGIYWIDRYGNKELIYRDEEIASIDPIPLRPRTRPPVLPDRVVLPPVEQVQDEDLPPAVVSLINVYDADQPWPSGTRIAALRIIQVLPKSTPPPNKPRIGVANQTNARAVLGTVPVEPDGSAHFLVPPGREVYFQALDEEGLAVQSMRSGTYFQPGQQQTCLGCHERKHDSPPNSRIPLALRRPPSAIQPDVDGSNPFNFVRLVQPVLDRHCVQCHQEKKAIDLSGIPDGPNGWTRSYAGLAERYGFYFHVSNGSINQGIHGGSRSIPGKFGARVSKLMDYIGPEHYGVALSDDEKHRITLWLDCNSEFYGSYENTQAQARGEIVLPTLE